MALTTEQVKTGVIIGEYGGCLPACSGLITGKQNLICTTDVVVEEERGGKGVPVHRRRRPYIVPEYFIYEVPVDRDEELNIYGEAETRYEPANFKFFKSLPTIDKEKIRPVRYKPITYSYEGDHEIVIGGEAAQKHFSFTNFLISYDDEELIFDILTSEVNPFLITTFDNKNQLSRLYREDDEILELI